MRLITHYCKSPSHYSGLTNLWLCTQVCYHAKAGYFGNWFIFPQCKTSIDNISGSIKHRTTTFACSVGFSAMVDRLMWPPSLSRDRTWARVTKCTHLRVVGLRLEGSLVYCYWYNGSRLVSHASDSAPTTEVPALATAVTTETSSPAAIDLHQTDDHSGAISGTFTEFNLVIMQY